MRMPIPGAQLTARRALMAAPLPIPRPVAVLPPGNLVMSPAAARGLRDGTVTVENIRRIEAAYREHSSPLGTSFATSLTLDGEATIRVAPPRSAEMQRRAQEEVLYVDRDLPPYRLDRNGNRMPEGGGR